MEKQSKSKGISFMAALALLFIGLKLANIINWSWWLVLLPLYGGLAIMLIGLLIEFSYAFFKAFFDRK